MRRSAAILSILIFCAAALFADTPTASLINRFTELDEAITQSLKRFRRCQEDSVMAAAAVLDLLQRNGPLQAVALIDPRGRLIAAASDDGHAKEFDGSLARKEWFAEPRKTVKPYYGPLTRFNDHICLAWGQPLYRRNALGMKSSEAVLVSFVNVAECLKEFAAAYRRPFEVIHRGDAFFHTDDWRDNGAVEQEPFSLMGGIEFTLRYIDSPLTTASPGGDAAETVQHSGLFLDETDSSLRHEASSKRQSGGGAVLFILVAALLVSLSFGVFYYVKLRLRMSAENPPRDELARLIEGEKDTMRSRVLADMYREIRAQIEKTLRPKMEEEVRATVRREVETAVRGEPLEPLREEIREELAGRVREVLSADMRRNMSAQEMAALREEVRAAMLAEEGERLRGELGGQIEVEAHQTLTRKIHAEVRKRHEKAIAERAYDELRERIRQEVDIRERSLLFSQVREALREEIERSIRQREGERLREEARLANRSAPASPSSGELDHETADGTAVLSQVRRALGAFQERETQGSFEHTVALLKEQRRESRFFNMNAAQTSGMIDYLDTFSSRLREFISDLHHALHNGKTEELRPEPEDKTGKEGPANVAATTDAPGHS